jgi:hypothetical protein
MWQSSQQKREGVVFAAAMRHNVNNKTTVHMGINAVKGYCWDAKLRCCPYLQCLHLGGSVPLGQVPQALCEITIKLSRELQGI